jgi:hypothetical protein
LNIAIHPQGDAGFSGFSGVTTKRDRSAQHAAMHHVFCETFAPED